MNDAPIFLPLPRVTDDIHDRPTLPAMRTPERSFFIVTPDGPVDGWQCGRDRPAPELEWWQNERRTWLARWVFFTLLIAGAFTALALLR